MGEYQNVRTESEIALATGTELKLIIPHVAVTLTAVLEPQLEAQPYLNTTSTAAPETASSLLLASTLVDITEFNLRNGWRLQPYAR